MTILIDFESSFFSDLRATVEVALTHGVITLGHLELINEFFDALQSALNLIDC